MTQTQYNGAHEEAIQVLREYASGMLLLSELKDRIAAINAPYPNPSQRTGLIDPATGLSF